MKLHHFLVAASAAALLSSCGSVARGTTEQVTIKTLPEDAKIRTSLGPSCDRSPCTREVKRRDTFTATAEKPGYKTGSAVINIKVSGSGAAGFAGNVLAGGVIGMGVDGYNKSSYDHYPNPALIVLEPLDPKNPKTPAYSAPAPVVDTKKAGKPAV